MGHCHTSEEWRGSRAVWGADDGIAPLAGQRREGEGIEARALAPAERRLAAVRLMRLSLGVRVALYALRFYKAYLSMLFAGSCRFEPTCSRYAYEAVERFGVARGVLLGLKRLLRCHPLSRKFGYDPVPESWKSHAV